MPVRPPLRFGEGVVEVGWDGSSDPLEAMTPESGVSAEIFAGPELDEDDLPSEPGPSQTPLDVAGDEEHASVGEEMIHDRYAALQAWNELEENLVRGRPRLNTESPVTHAPSGLEKGDDEPVDLEEEGRLESGLRLPLSGNPDVRVEDQHGFAPYSQLFSRLRQTRETP